jgi:hypothetical protein
MRRVQHSLLSLALAIGLAGCASPRTGRAAPRVDRSIITQAELLERHFNNAYEAVEALRSNWLKARGPDSFSSPSIVLVYMDEVRLGDVTTLRSVEPGVIGSIQHFDGPSATARWGIGHGAGVILINTVHQVPNGDSSRELETQMVSEGEVGVAGGFALASGGHATPLVVSASDFTGVRRAVDDLRTDIGRVSGVQPRVVLDSTPAREMVIVGTIGRSLLIDRLVAAKRLDVAAISGKWESYVREVVTDPMPGVDQALIIAGSDKRGTIYGVYDLSSLIGVSPWYWWADVAPRHRSELLVPPARVTQGEPAVKYRGIFINDEAPAFSGWTHAKFGGVNHQVYAKVFELILRLKGNYLWPAMWGNAFADDDSLDAKLADEYGVVMGTSHHEPMTRAQQEWRRYGKGPWNYETNDSTLRDFWRKGIERMDGRENIVTLGMRGDGDMPMTQGSNVALLERIVADQRKILTEVTGKDASKTPTLWALYKEVQDYYDKGMRVPDDVTLLFSDDNWGNIRRLPSPDERDRTGGFGIYYHFDYVGGPRNYKWINTNPIARVWEQMHLAHEYGANRIWIVNVGDLKPMEFPIQFFLDYAWDPSKLTADRLPAYTRQWANQQFGPEHAAEIADVVTKTLKYAGRRKPELLSPDTYSLANYREAETVVADYQALAREAARLAALMPADLHDAFYELVQHPVLAAANLNELYVTAAKNRLYAMEGRSSTNALADRVRQLFDRDAAITAYYNDTLAGGKWSHMMDQTHIGYTYWQEPPRNVMPRVDVIQVPVPAEMGVSYEGQGGVGPPRGAPSGGRPRFEPPELPQFDPYSRQSHFIDVYDKGQQPFRFAASAAQPWVKLSATNGTVDSAQRIIVSVDWDRAPAGTSRVPITVTGPSPRPFVVQAIVTNPSMPKRDDLDGFVEGSGYVSIEAEHYTSAIAPAPIHWLRIPDLGRTLSAMTPTPVTSPSQTPGGGSPRLEYRMFLFDSGAVKVTAFLSPTLNFTNSPHGLRYAISFDDEAPQVVNMTADSSLKAWEQSVSDNVTTMVTTHQIAHPGEHLLSFWMVDPGIVLQKLVVDAGGVRPSYLGPPESVHVVKQVSRR